MWLWYQKCELHTQYLTAILGIQMNITLERIAEDLTNGKLFQSALNWVGNKLRRHMASLGHKQLMHGVAIVQRN